MDSEQSLSQTLKRAWYGALFGTLFGLIFGVLYGFEELGKLDHRLIPMTLIALIGSEIGMACMTLGFVRLGKLYENRALFIGATIILVANILGSLFFLLYYIFPQLDIMYSKKEFLNITVIITGILSIPYGFGLLALKKHFGDLVLWTGIINLCASLLAALGYLYKETIEFSSLLLLLATIMEIMIIHDAYKKFPMNINKQTVVNSQ